MDLEYIYDLWGPAPSKPPLRLIDLSRAPYDTEDGQRLVPLASKQ